MCMLYFVLCPWRSARQTDEQGGGCGEGRVGKLVWHRPSLTEVSTPSCNTSTHLSFLSPPWCEIEQESSKHRNRILLADHWSYLVLFSPPMKTKVSKAPATEGVSTKRRLRYMDRQMEPLHALALSQLPVPVLHLYNGKEPCIEGAMTLETTARKHSEPQFSSCSAFTLYFVNNEILKYGYIPYLDWYSLWRCSCQCQPGLPIYYGQRPP